MDKDTQEQMLETPRDMMNSQALHSRVQKAADQKTKKLKHDSDSSGDEMTQEKMDKLGQRICKCKWFNKIPDQKKPLEDYQIELAKLRIQQEIFPLSKEPCDKMFPKTCFCCKSKKAVEVEDGEDKYKKVRNSCVHQEAKDIDDAIKHTLLKNYNSQQLVNTSKSDEGNKEMEDKLKEEDKLKDKVWLQQFDLEIYHAKQHEKLKIDVKPQQRTELEKDPLISKGTGIQGFRQITRVAMVLFFFLSLICMPIFTIYKNGTEAVNNHILKNSLFGNYTLGNLGQNSMQCSNSHLPKKGSWNSINLVCPYGNITEIPNNGIGINAYTQPIRDACVVNQTLFGNDECSSAIDLDWVRFYFQASCVGKNTCQVKFGYEKDDLQIFSKGALEHQSAKCIDDRSQIFMQYSCTIDDVSMNQKWMDLSIVTGCVSLIGFLFIGFTIFLEKNLEVMSITSDMLTTTADDYTVQLDFSSNNMFNQFFTNTENRDKIHKDHKGSAAAAFKQYLMEELPFKMALYGKDVEDIADVDKLRNRVTKENDKKKVRSGVDMTQLRQDIKDNKIVDINFAFKNHQLINLLYQRGDAIQSKDYTKKDKVESKINKQIFDNYGQVSEMNKIITAFITFDSHSGYDQAIELGDKKHSDFEFLGSHPQFKVADSPQDIMWEKLQITAFDMNKILKQTVYLIAMISFVFFFGIGDLAKKSLEQQIQYTSQNCELIRNEYSQTGKLNEERQEHFKTYAGQEYMHLKDAEYTISNDKPNMYSGNIFGLKNLYTTKNATLETSTPQLACYCRLQDKGIYDLITEKPKNHTFIYNGETKSEPICATFRKARLEIFSFRYVAIFLLILTAHKLRLVVEHTVSKLGTDNGASSGSYVIFTVFFCQIFNFAFLLLSANMNMMNQGVIFNFLPSPFVFDGMFTDFTTNFYAILGDTFVLVLLINVIFQIVFEVFILIIQALRKWWDRRGVMYTRLAHQPDSKLKEGEEDKTENEGGQDQVEDHQGKSEKFNTKCTSIKSYIELHGAQKFHRHWRFSQLMVLVYMSMMFGAAIPLMFVVSFISCFIYYYEQIILIFKFYIVEPKHGMRQNQNAIGYLKAAPLFLFSFGFWQLSNFQLFNYKGFPLQPIIQTSIPAKQEHTLLRYWSFDFVQNSGPAFPLLIWFFIYLLYLIFSASYNPLKSPFYNEQVDCTKEYLPSYTENLTDEQRQWTQKEQIEYKNKFGLSISHIQDKQYFIKKEKTVYKNQITGLHTYDILRNPIYAERFQYISMYVPAGYDRTKINQDGDDNDLNNEAQSDLVRLALFLPFLSKEDQDSFRFSEIWWEDHIIGRSWKTHREKEEANFLSCDNTLNETQDQE